MSTPAPPRPPVALGEDDVDFATPSTTTTTTIFAAPPKQVPAPPRPLDETEPLISGQAPFAYPLPPPPQQQHHQYQAVPRQAPPQPQLQPQQPRCDDGDFYLDHLLKEIVASTEETSEPSQQSPQLLQQAAFASARPSAGSVDYRPSNAFSGVSTASIVPTRAFGDCNLARIHNSQSNFAFASGSSSSLGHVNTAALAVQPTPSSTTSATPGGTGKLRTDTRFDFPIVTAAAAGGSAAAPAAGAQPQPQHVDAAVLLSKPASTVTAEPVATTNPASTTSAGEVKKSLGGGTYKTAPNGPMAYNHIDIISESAREGGADDAFGPGAQLYSLCIQGMPANADDNYLVHMVEKHCPAFVKADLVSVHVPAMTRASLKKNHNKRFGFLNYKTREASEATTASLDRLDIPPVGYLRVQPSVPKRGFRAATAAAAAAVEKTASNFGTGLVA